MMMMTTKKNNFNIWIAWTPPTVNYKRNSLYFNNVFRADTKYRNFSSTNNTQNNKNVLTYSVNDCNYYIFSSLNNVVGFERDLNYILNCFTNLDEYYEIDYYLYLWSNDYSKFFLHIKTEHSVLDNIEYDPIFMNHTHHMYLLENTFFLQRIL